MKKPYVAIVDDDSGFANYLRTFLSLRGYETRAYSRGEEMVMAVKQGDRRIFVPVTDASEASPT